MGIISGGVESSAKDIAISMPLLTSSSKASWETEFGPDSSSCAGWSGIPISASSPGNSTSIGSGIPSSSFRTGKGRSLTGLDPRNSKNKF